jgi:ADP-ribose pyrophosphatase YjhB (NUDIX family)
MTSARAPRLGSAVIVVSDGRVLLGRRAKDPNRGKWVVPGGGVRPFESIAEAGRRELLEETGLEIEVDGVVAVREIINEPDEHRLIVFSAGRPVGGRIHPASDLDDVRFFSQAEIQELAISAVVRSVLDEQGWVQPIAA